MQIIEIEKLSQISGGPLTNQEIGYLNSFLDAGGSYGSGFYQMLYWSYAND